MGQDQPIINNTQDTTDKPSTSVNIPVLDEYMPPESPPTSPPPIPDSYNSFGGRKMVATVLGIVFLVTGVATGVMLINRQQQVKISAFECENYTFEIGSDGTIRVLNGSVRKVGNQQVYVYINEIQEETFNVPEIEPGDSVIVGETRELQPGTNWRATGSIDCESEGTISN